MHGNVTIGNNQLASNSFELNIGNNCTYNFGNRQYNVFNDTLESSSGFCELPGLIQGSNSQDIIANNTWWGSNISTSQEVVNHCMLWTHSQNGPTTLNVGTMATSSHGASDFYPNTSSDLSSWDAIVAEAYDEMDTLASDDRSEIVFELKNLAFLGYHPALRALVDVYILDGYSKQQITSELYSIIDEGEYADFDVIRDFVSSEVELRFNNISGAAESFAEIAENVGNPIDSLTALISQAEAERLNLILGGGAARSTSGVPAKRGIQLFDTKIEDLHKQLTENMRNGGSNSAALPKEFALHACYPNPFNPTVSVPFSVPNVSDVKIQVFNVLGQRVETLIDRKINAGNHRILWNGTSNGMLVSSGIYFVRMEADGFIKSRKIVLMK